MTQHGRAVSVGEQDVEDVENEGASDVPPYPTEDEDAPVALTSYVGRAAEIDHVVAELASSRFVTLVGPGGVGKTRLALQVASKVRDQFADGVIFLGLAELTEPELLASLVGERLGLADRQAGRGEAPVIEALRERQSLLILDNCEHMVPACAELSVAILQNCPEMALLATSRQSLGVAGEHIQPVDPLAVPDPEDVLEDVAASDAVRLFVDRARAVVPSFQVTPSNVVAVVRLVRQLEGLPLAIELAAIRVRALSVGQIADRMDEQLALLTGQSLAVGPNHHGTLRALIDWSYQRCTAAEAAFWGRVSVFAGSFDLEAAEKVAAGDDVNADDVLALVDGLLNKSILLREEYQDAVRYRMLEPLRQYGQDKLAVAGQLVQARRRHRDYFAGLVEMFHEDWLSDRQIEWSARLRVEHANLRAALEFSATTAEEAESGLLMVWNLKEFFLMKGLNTEGRLLASKLLAVAPRQTPAWFRAQWAYGFLARLQGDVVAYREAVAVLAEASDESIVAHTQLLRGYDALIDDRMSEATDEFGRAAAAFEVQQDLASELWTRFNLGIATGLAGDLDQGRLILRETITVYAERGEIFWRAWALWSLGALELLAGDIDQARQAVQEVLRFEQRITDRVLVAFALTIASGVATRSGHDRRSARTFGAAMAAWKAIAATPTKYGAFGDNIREDIDLVTSRLGPEAAGEEFSVGYAMSIDEAVAYALTDAPSPEPERSSRDILTRRESEVAELVAQGMTNQEIADTLVISRRTAETHVNNILNKLDFSSRAQVAAWVVGGNGADNGRSRVSRK